MPGVPDRGRERTRTGRSAVAAGLGGEYWRSIRGEGVDLIADPPRGVGGLLIGMPVEAAVARLRGMPGYVDGGGPGFAHFESDLSIAIEGDRDGAVTSIEAYRPGPDVTVTCEGVDIFAMPAEEVIRQLSARVRLEITGQGRHVVAPDLLLALWRATLPDSPADEDGRYFGSVLIARPGYYDGPAR